MVLFLLRAAKEQDPQLGMSLAQLFEQREVVVERPAPEGEILGAARADMNAEPLAPGPVMPRDEVLGPFQVRGGEEDLVFMPGQQARAPTVSSSARLFSTACLP